MAKTILAVYDPCPDYVERFISYINRKKNRNYEAEGFTDLSILMARLQDNKIKAVLLSLDEIKSNERIRVQEVLGRNNNRNDLVILFLGEQPAAGRETEETDRYIDRYQPMEQILSDIDSRLHLQEAFLAKKHFTSRFSVSGIYSPADKCSHPEVAAALAAKQCKADSGKPVKMLYINLEQFSGMKTLLDYEKETSISDVIYYYRTNPGKLAEGLVKVKGSYKGMDVLTAPADLRDLEEIGKKGWPDFLNALSLAGDYPYILIDMSVCEMDILEVVLEYGNLYIPALPYSRLNQRERLESLQIPEERMQLRDRDKIQEFRKYLMDAGMDSRLQKIMEVQSDAG